MTYKKIKSNPPLCTEAMVRLTCPRLTSRDLLALDGNLTLVVEFASGIEYHYTTGPKISLYDVVPFNGNK